MEDFNQKATKEIADMIQYVAEDAVKNAPYDKTRNATITKVYYAQDEWNIYYINGYDVKVDGKLYHLTKERGKGVIAKVNDVVKLHFPCNNSNLIYLSYPHDAEDFISELYWNEGDSVILKYNSSRTEFYSPIEIFSVIFPATTKQFSSVDITFSTNSSLGHQYLRLPFSDIPYRIRPTCENGISCVVMSSGVYQIDNTHYLTIRFYNENPTTTAPVTKNIVGQIIATGIVRGNI